MQTYLLSFLSSQVVRAVAQSNTITVFCNAMTTRAATAPTRPGKREQNSYIILNGTMLDGMCRSIPRQVFMILTSLCILPGRIRLSCLNPEKLVAHPQNPCHFTCILSNNIQKDARKGSLLEFITSLNLMEQFCLTPQTDDNALQVAASANYRGVQWMLGFAWCVSSQYGITLTVR